MKLSYFEERIDKVYLCLSFLRFFLILTLLFISVLIQKKKINSKTFEMKKEEKQLDEICLFSGDFLSVLSFIPFSKSAMISNLKVCKFLKLKPKLFGKKLNYYQANMLAVAYMPNNGNL